MKNVSFLLLCAILLIGSACSFYNNKKEEKLVAEDFNTIEIQNRYKIRIPNYMTEAKDLSDEASLQYQNIFKETYTVVIDEPKQEFIDAFVKVGFYDSTLSASENYRNTQLGLIEERMDVTSKSDPVRFKIGKFEAHQVEIDGHVEGVEQEISYLFTFMGSDEDMYMIMSWTLKTRKEKYFNTFKEIANSLRTRKS